MWSDERARVTGMWDTRAHAVVLIGKVCGHHEVDHGVIEELSKCWLCKPQAGKQPSTERGRIELQLVRRPRVVVKVCDNASRYVSVLVGYDLNSGGIVDSKFVYFDFLQSPRLMVFGW